MKKKCAVVCSQGLGDGLIFLTLSHNLYLNGYEVDTFHPALFSLQRWFPHLPLKPMPEREEIPATFSSYDKIFINSDATEINRLIQKYALATTEKEKWILHPSTCRGNNLPGDFRFCPDQTIVSNLLNFCTQKLALSKVVRENGCTPPESLVHRKEPKRVVIHPTCKNERRNWSSQKFLKLAHKLREEGYEPSFVTAPFERKRWEWVQYDGFFLPSFSSLDQMASFLYESGYFVGMDSGLGHLASCMQIKTLSIFTNTRKKEFWRPDWAEGTSIAPSSFLPNFKGMRLRDRYGKFLLRPKQVFRQFLLLIDKESRSL